MTKQSLYYMQKLHKSHMAMKKGLCYLLNAAHFSNAMFQNSIWTYVC